MGDPTPDGKVDFNDLMVFATAYGSEVGDPNWNALCDICGYLGDPTPDGQINFDDLMVFATNYGKEIETIIPETTEIIDQETEEAILSVSEDQSTMVLSYSTPQADSIEVGDIIIMGVTDQTPYGLLRKVTGVDKGTTKYSPLNFYLGFATLEEAVQKGHWEYSQTLKPEDIEKGFVFPEGIRPVTGKASTTLDHEYEINVILYDQDNNPATTENNITATGYLAFNYQVTFDGDIDGHTLKYFIFENIIETDSELNISVGLSVSIADLANVADVTIGEPIPFTPVTVYIPTPIPLIVIPLVFFPSIELKVGIEGEATIKLDVGITQTTSYTAGIEFIDGDWQNITDPLPNIVNTIKLADPEGTIHLTAHAGPQLNCKLYKVAGPYCNIFGYLYFDADTTLDPWWDLDAGLTVSAGVKMDVLSIHWDSGELPLFDLLPRFDVAEADGPYGGTSAVHNLTKDTYYNTIQVALNDADSGDTIEVDDGTYDESITFPSGKKIILQSINGKSFTIIRGNDGSNTVTISNSLDGTTLEGFTITHESGNSGMGIYIYSGYLSINNSTISDNNHNDSMYIEGCGIYNAGADILTITNSTISDNTSANVAGGIRSMGPLTITNSIISNNTSDHDDGGIENVGTSTIADSTISGNTGNSGGGIVNTGALTITNSTISDNISINCFDNAAGIINTGALTITNSTISDNSGGSRSGGIYNTLYGQLIITGSTISNNTSCHAAGGIFNVGALTITNSTISDNSGTSDYACGIFLQASSGPNIIGGSNENDFSNFNEFINNYKIGDVPSPDRHIRNADDGDCHMDYPNNYYTPDNNGGINYTPVISSLTADPPSIDIDQTTSITCIASDEDIGDTLSYTWTKNGGVFEGSTVGSTITWRAPSTPDNYMVSCEVSDGETSDSKQVVITVNDLGTSYPVHNLTKDTYYDTIQAAINNADNGDTIEVSPRTYYENINFMGKNITLQSTDPTDPSVVASTIIDGGGNGSVVTFASDETDQAVLRGFTIQNGMVTGSHGRGYGGGISVYYSSPTITGNTINNNTANIEGGGIYVRLNRDILPTTDRPTGWGTGRENIPTGDLLVPGESVVYTIAGNEFVGNEHGDPLDYTEGAHVYFEPES
jgi:hypothetical protein